MANPHPTNLKRRLTPPALSVESIRIDDTSVIAPEYRTCVAKNSTRKIIRKAGVRKKETVVTPVDTNTHIIQEQKSKGRDGAHLHLVSSFVNARTI